MKVVHVIIGLNVGGAELMLKRLIESHLGRQDIEHSVISLTDQGLLGEKLIRQGVSVHCLGMTSITKIPKTFLRLRNLIRKLKPDVIQTWMYHSDFIGGLAARSVGMRNILWNVRNTRLSGKGIGNYWFRRLCGWLSYSVPEKVLYVSDSAKLAHECNGYNPEKSEVIYNGFDLERFRFDENIRITLRRSLGITDDKFLICSVGRFTREKDHVTFIKAVKKLIEFGLDVGAIMLGQGIDWENEKIVAHIKGFQDNFHLLGPQEKVQDFLSCADVFCLHSITEGFPNVLGEAMAVGLPCVTTRAGDAEKILNSQEFTVNVGDYEALAKVLKSVSDLSYQNRKSIGCANRLRVTQEYSLACTVEKFEQLYRGFKH